MGESIMTSQLPIGFTLDEPDKPEEFLPQGFAIDKPEGSTADAFIEPVKSIGANLIGAVGSGLGGIYELIKTGDMNAAANAVNAMQQDIAKEYAPQTQAGKEGLENVTSAIQSVEENVIRPAIGGTAGLASLALNPTDLEGAKSQVRSIKEHGLGKSLGGQTFEATGSPALSAIAETLPTAIESALPAGIAGKASKSARTGMEIKNPFTKSTATQNKIMELISEGSKDVETAAFKVEKRRPLLLGGGKVTESVDVDAGFYDKLLNKISTGKEKLVTDKVAQETINQGFDEGVIAAVKTASPKDKAKMLKMADSMERGKNNKLYAMKNRPSDIAGDSLLDRVSYVLDTNKQAGSELNKVAKSLKGKQVNFDDAVNGFTDSLDEIGVTFNNDLTPNFNGSDIEGLPGVENVISQVVKRMQSGGVKGADAHDVHRMKKYIDELVTYGKTTEGMSGRVEGILKGLRRNLDSALDSQFPEYDRVNTVYANTIGALDDLQSATGKKMNLSGPSANKALGTELRKLMSNYRSRIDLLDSIKSIETTAKKYGGKFDDDIMTQVLFVDELNSVFGTPARTSLEGMMERGTKRGFDAVSGEGGLFRTGVELTGEALEKARGINEKNAFKTIKELLKSK